MPTYAVGDVQGCYRSLRALLERVAFQAGRDRVWLAGDLVNRGPRSLEVLRWAAEQDAQAPGSLVAVLGNHDLHLLAAAAGLRRPGRRDTLDAVLAAPDREGLLAWLRRRPLLHSEGDTALVHAGLRPEWTLAEAERLARAAEGALQGEGWRDLLQALYREGGGGEVAAAMRAMTSMRVLRRDGSLDLEFSGPPAERPAGTVPWFQAPVRRSAGARVVFGHWAALGLHLADGVVGLDTGCVWGRQLTAYRLEDGALFEQPRVD